VLPLLACACITTGIAASKNAAITHPARFFLSVIFILLSRPCEIFVIPISYCLGTKTPSATAIRMAPPRDTKHSHSPTAHHALLPNTNCQPALS
jgi:hypothetical protein